LFPLALSPPPPPLVAPCAAAPLPEPAPPPPARTPDEAGAAGAADVLWADVGAVREPEVALSLDWAILQLLPSPELGVGDGARFGLRWQLTPLLYSFATDSRLDRWRWLVVEPIVRHSGSIELFASPEYLALDGGVAARFGVRGGLRAYFGLLGRGDNLSVSLGASYYHFRDADGVAFEAGAYVLFGGLGLVLTHSPGFDAAPWLVTLRLRYF
jgi:hypothetical protein